MAAQNEALFDGPHDELLAVTHEGQPWRQALLIEGRSVIKDRLKKLGQQFLGEQKAEEQAPEPAVERRAAR